MRRGSLREQRPGWLRDASRASFGQQSTAAQERSYGAVGGADYQVEAIVGRERRTLWSLLDAVAAQPDPAALRVLDLGTGDGHLLLSLHERFGIPWANLVGVSAEDMRGQKELEGLKEPLDLREWPEASGSYIVWNIEDLDRCPDLRGRTFDLIVSWVTFCWLTDPIGDLELVHDVFLAPGGLLVCGGLQLQVAGVPPIEDRVYLTDLQRRLRAEGHLVDVLQDSMNAVYCWWFHRKPRAEVSLRLWPLVRHGALADGCFKAAYEVELERGPQPDAFRPELLTVFPH